MHELPRNAILDKTTGKIIVQQPLPPFNCIALEGGGVRGSAYAGAFRVLSRYGLLNDVQHVAGSSAGAIAALIIALGYSPEEMMEQLQSIPMAAFIEQKPAWSFTPNFFTNIKNAYSIITNERIALSSGTIMLDWLKARIKEKLGNEDATFADLAAAVNSQNNQHARHKMKYLYVTATNIGVEIPECVVFSHETKPQADTSIAKAVCASGTFPWLFAAVDINGGKFVDGGCKNNLPAKVFDKTRFLPTGYDFTQHGVNPGTLSIKIDYQDEINQVIWGINKPYEIKSVKELTAAVTYAFADNIDATEVRESRVVLPLTDNNVSSLNLTIDTNGRINLCTAAEDTTQDFLENHMNGAQNVIVFDSIQEWLKALRLDELDDIINLYRHMPPAPNLQNYIDFLEKYFSYKRDSRHDPDAEFNLPFPDYHINIKPEVSKTAWSQRLKMEMEERIIIMNKHLATVEDKIQYTSRRFNAYEDELDAGKLHDDNFEHTKLLTGFLEYQRILNDEKVDLEMKLGLRAACDPPEKFNHRYDVLCKVIQQYRDTKNVPPPVNAIISIIDIFNPTIRHRSTVPADNIFFTYQLRNIDDCKIFLIAAILYLEHKKSKDATTFEKVYSEIFRGATCPKSMEALSLSLDLNGSSLLCSAYRIEELMQHFERTETPGVKSTINLDQSFGITENPISRFFSRHARHSPHEMGIALHNIIRTHPPRRQKILNHDDSNDIEMKSTRHTL